MKGMAEALKKHHKTTLQQPKRKVCVIISTPDHTRKVADRVVKKGGCMQADAYLKNYSEEGCPITNPPTDQL